MMKILGINASHKKSGGNTQIILDHLFAGAKQNGAQFEVIRMADCDIRQCIACDSCQKRNDYGCIHDEKDDFIKVLRKFSDFDIVIYATPIYIFQMASKLKVFLERIYSRGKSNVRTFTNSNLLFHDIDRSLLCKPFVSLITSSNIERESTLNVEEYFKIFSRFMDAPHVGSIVRNGCSMLFNKDCNTIQNTHMNEVLKNIQEAGKHLASRGFISKRLEHRISGNVLPIPQAIFKLLKKTSIGRAKILEKAI